MNVVLCDVDHTVSDAAWRDYLLGDWDRYHALQYMDEPITPVIALVEALHRGGCDVVYLTARPEKWRAQTEKWLEKNCPPAKLLLMRPHGNHEPSPVVKLSQAKLHYPDLRSVVVLLMDDRQDVCEAFSREGVTVLQTRKPA